MRPLMRIGTVTFVTLAAAGLIAVSARAAAPSNTSSPSITGTPEQGRTLTAHNGTWSNSPSRFFYRWQRCAADGTSCGDIDNATHRTYVLKENDVDQTVRVVVTASNTDGQSSANSTATDVISSNVAPKNTVKPTISGTAQVGAEFTATRGTWTGGVRSFSSQWQRCDQSGTGCTDAAGATGTTYGVRAADVGHTLRFVVTAKNLAGSTTVASSFSATVKTDQAPPTTTPAPAVNHRPSIKILSARIVRARVYLRMRVCDDSRRNVSIHERDSKHGVASYNRRFRTLVPPITCSRLGRVWRPAPRFKNGHYVVTLWARDFAGLRSAPAVRRFFR